MQCFRKASDCWSLNAQLSNLAWGLQANLCVGFGFRRACVWDSKDQGGREDRHAMAELSPGGERRCMGEELMCPCGGVSDGQVSGCQPAGCVCSADFPRTFQSRCTPGHRRPVFPRQAVEGRARPGRAGEGVTVPCHPAFDFPTPTYGLVLPFPQDGMAGCWEVRPESLWGQQEMSQRNMYF